eukprot:TRINITY_DN9683_c0_g1_i1.p1 TRINITY_DN9683_c0_g1~~TRINITY_DN9683_c0_g1_i1.p1  ORF type:complete len:322 (-),score=71.63 TRINITY_DN9683_c0_g1_i1:253-1218(-)
MVSRLLKQRHEALAAADDLAALQKTEAQRQDSPQSNRSGACGAIGSPAAVPSPTAGQKAEKPPLDPHWLMELDKFDSNEASLAAVEAATVAEQARGASQRAAAKQSMQDEVKWLEAKIKEVHREDLKETQAHHELVRNLMGKLEYQRPTKPVSDASLEPSRRSLRLATIAASRRPSSVQKDSSSRRPSTRGRRSTVMDAATSRKSTPASDAFLGPSNMQKDIDLSSPVEQWGALVVGRLGLNSFPTRPRSWNTCMSRSKGWIPPRAARSVEEVQKRNPFLPGPGGLNGCSFLPLDSSSIIVEDSLLESTVLTKDLDFSPHW